MQYTSVHGYDIPLGICVLVALNLALRIGAFVCLEFHSYRHLSKICRVCCEVASR